MVNSGVAHDEKDVLTNVKLKQMLQLRQKAQFLK